MNRLRDRQQRASAAGHRYPARWTVSRSELCAVFW